MDFDNDKTNINEYGSGEVFEQKETPSEPMTSQEQVSELTSVQVPELKSVPDSVHAPGFINAAESAHTPELISGSETEHMPTPTPIPTPEYRSGLSFGLAGSSVPRPVSAPAPEVTPIFMGEVPTAMPTSTASPTPTPTAPPTSTPYPIPVGAPAGTGSTLINESIKDQREQNKRGKFRRVAALVISASLVGGLAVGFGIGLGIPVSQRYLVPPTPKVSEEPFAYQLPSLGAVTNGDDRIGYADIIERVEPSVVLITSKVVSPNRFGATEAPSGLGSGILFHENDEKCFIVTNSHVISGADAVDISVCGSEPVPVALVGKNESADLAVISVLKDDLRKVGINKVVLAEFGDSDQLRMGDLVLAIGNAMGEGNSVTNGLVSAKDRQIVTNTSAVLSVIQTNAAINPGNSGGPLVSMDGLVVGITTAKMGNVYSGGFDIFQDNSLSAEGTGYAIPSNTVVEIITDLMNQKSRPKMGVTVRTLSEEFARLYNLPSAGALVEAVVPGSGADKAGIIATDIITGFNGQPVLTNESLIQAVSECNVGDKVEVKIIRNGKEYLTVTVELAEVNASGF